MTLPKTYRAYRRTGGDAPRSIELTTEHLPAKLAHNDVIIKIHAISLNFRDVAMLDGRYILPVSGRGIPASDCAGEVVAVGSDVTTLKIGDRVSPVVNFNDPMMENEDDEVEVLGDDKGVLAEYAVFNQRALVKVAEHLSWEEASTVPCCGITAWMSLDQLKTVGKDTKVLLQGTGGVSMFALLLCVAANITPIISSSSDSKLENIKKLSPLVKGYNYKTEPNQASSVKGLTDGTGVNIVINNTGPASFPADLDSLRQKHGMISLVGFLDQSKPDWDPNTILGLVVKGARLQGIRGGTRADLEDVNSFIERHKVRLNSIIDSTFDFNNAKAAFDHLASGRHVGKVVISF